MNFPTWHPLLPEFLLFTTGVLLSWGERKFMTPRAVWWAAMGMAVFALLLSLLAVSPQFWPHVGSVLDWELSHDLAARALRFFALFLGTLYVAMAYPEGRLTEPALGISGSLISLAGMGCVAAAQDVMVLLLGLELSLLPLYGNVLRGSDDRCRREAVVKLFLLGFVSCWCAAFGLSFLYGLTGTTRLLEIQAAMASGLEPGQMRLGLLALVLLFAGWGFRIGIVPFHFHLSDVFQGVSASSAGWLDFVAKLTGSIALLRVVVIALPAFSRWSWQLALALSVLSMIVSGLLAFQPGSPRRFLAHLSVHNGGVFCGGLAIALASSRGADVAAAVSHCWIFLLGYLLSSACVFAALQRLENGGFPLRHVEELQGMASARPGIAACATLGLLSMAGAPLLVGFWSKLHLLLGMLRVAWQPPLGDNPFTIHFLLLAAAMVFSSLLVWVGVLRVVLRMYEPVRATAKETNSSPWTWAAMAAPAILIVGMGIFPQAMAQRVDQAAQTDLIRIAQDLPTPDVEPGRTPVLPTVASRMESRTIP